MCTQNFARALPSLVFMVSPREQCSVQIAVAAGASFVTLALFVNHAPLRVILFL